MSRAEGWTFSPVGRMAVLVTALLLAALALSVSNPEDAPKPVEGLSGGIEEVA